MLPFPLLGLLSVSSSCLSAAAMSSAVPSSTPAVLTYWKGRGRANPIRFMLEETGENWKESFLDGKEGPSGWIELQKTGKLMYGQVPLLEIDGLNLVQSEACLRYLARKHNMLGSNAAEGALIDMVHAATLDIRSGSLGVAFQPLPARTPHLQQHLATTVPKFLGPIDRLLYKSATGYVTGGDNVSMADITLFESVKFLLDAPYVSHDWFQAYPSVQKHYAMVAARPRISAYLSSDRCMPFPDDVYAAAVRASLS